ncbi:MULTISPECIES: glycosyltransferase family 4 protein [Acidiphilium]|uniref:glycosyltransferase family 4 protein n=1 Tax=Acidiphilium TaxID=522 RepID=UPI001B8CC839|nr:MULTISPECIES: glycosyltransferase family 4 protein [Acidiphilium]MBS3022446.1 glycosyltransferase family 4 protein [Acidiphilium multivorum]UNC15433.1 glycosyltransferase family 4 protein [Acidiphilium multivorum]
MNQPDAAGGIAMVLPASEAFAPGRAGAIALVVRRLAAATGASVIGAACAEPGFPGIACDPVRFRAPLAYNAGVLRRLRRLRPASIDIHQQPRLARLAARLLPGSRVMLFLHNEPTTMRGLTSPAARADTLRRLHAVVCVSDHLRARYATGLADTARLVTLHNPLTLAELPAPPDARRREILFAGRIVEGKGIADFIAASAAALPRLPGWSARIIGGDRFGPDSPETPFVREMRARAGAAGIAWDGYRPHDEVLAAMAGAAIVAVPSRWPEPFGLTALEAMAAGATLVATRAGGLPEVVGEAGLLVPPGDAAALEAAFLRLAGDDAARDRLAAAGRARAQLFDTPVIAARLQRLRDAETPV